LCRSYAPPAHQLAWLLQSLSWLQYLNCNCCSQFASGLYPSTNWPPVNRGQNSILDWIFKLNLSPNKKKKQQKIIFTCFSFWKSAKQGYLSWVFFKIK
jgi:hypothetical protein